MQWILAYARYISKNRLYINIGESGLNLKFSKINQSMEDRATYPIWRTTAGSREGSESKILVTASAGFMRAADD